MIDTIWLFVYSQGVMNNLFAEAIVKGQEALAAQKAAGISKHQWARNILPMHKLVILAFLVADPKTLDNKGMTLIEILNVIQSLGQRVTYNQLACTLVNMRHHEILKIVGNDAKAYHYQMVSKLNLSNCRH